jgi:hypothetical protein
MDQAARFEAVRQLKSGQAQCLVGTDVAARGLDVKGIVHVVGPAAGVSGDGVSGGALGVRLSFRSFLSFLSFLSFSFVVRDSVSAFFDIFRPRISKPRPKKIKR